MSGSEGNRRGFKAPTLNPLQVNNRRTFDSVLLQSNKTASKSQEFDADKHIRAINRAMIDAYVLLKDWPAYMRYSYFVGPDGKLITGGERRTGV